MPDVRFLDMEGRTNKIKFYTVIKKETMHYKVRKQIIKNYIKIRG